MIQGTMELTKELAKLTQQTEGKVYLQLLGKKEKIKGILEVLQGEIELLVCISAEEVLSAKYDLIGQIESDFWIFEHWGASKVHLVITGVNMNKKYDRIFRFEGALLRKGIKVWEHYATRLTTKNLQMLFSENWMGNNDHIPLGKKIALVMDYEVESGSFWCCVSQLFCDKELGIDSSFAVLNLEENRLSESDFWDFLRNEYLIFTRLRKYLWSVNNPIHDYSCPQDMMLC